MSLPEGAPRVYLAGWDVFHPTSREIGDRLIATCAEYGIAGVYPDPAFDPGLSRAIASARGDGAAIADLLFKANVASIRSCQGLIANLAPFRGPGADGGTTWEMGFAYGLGLPVWAYSADIRPYRQKVADWNKVPLVKRAGMLWDRDGLMVEDLGEQDNLMETRSIENKGAVAVSFLAAVQQAAGQLVGPTAGLALPA